jgi:hypothetical protein
MKRWWVAALLVAAALGAAALVPRLRPGAPGGPPVEGEKGSIAPGGSGGVLTAAGAGEAPRVAGARLRRELAAAAPRAELAGTVVLAVHVGLARVGKLVLATAIVDKGGESLYRLEDALSFDAEGFGAVNMTLAADLGPDFSVRQLAFYSSAPGPSGATSRHRLGVERDGSSLVLTEARDEEKATRSPLEGVPLDALFLTPPFGIGERLARLARGEAGSRWELDARDLARGEPALLSLAAFEVAKLDVRGQSLDARRVTRAEGRAALDEWLVPGSAEPLEIVRSDGPARLSFVGRESAERKEDLPAPAPSERASEGPVATVLRFLRASGRGDAAEVESVLDVDELFEASGATDRSEKFKATFKKTLLALLTGPDWRRGESMKLLANATRADDFAEDGEHDRAVVYPIGAKDGPSFALMKEADGVWRITRLPRRP